MKYVRGFYFAVAVVALTACATPRLPEFVAAPEPPLKWNVVLDEKVGCPNANGQYESIPTVAELQQDGKWRISSGNWYDYLLLLPYSRVKADKWIPNETPHANSRSSLVLESDNQLDTLRITSSDKNTEYLATHVFRKDKKDYTCDAGILIFPEFEIQGGTEGVFLNGKTYRQATITSGGDLLFYEQVQSYKTVHKYYLFKLMDS
ncbi:hypothetical protein ACFL1J_08445 [Pseudomonadota bacterium]